MDNLDELLQWRVYPPGGRENELDNTKLTEWWAIGNDDGITAYFRNGLDAFRFRLSEINRKLKG